MSKTKGRRTSMDILEIDDDTTHKSTSRARRGMSVGDIQDLTDEEEDEDSSEDSEDELVCTVLNAFFCSLELLCGLFFSVLLGLAVSHTTFIFIPCVIFYIEIQL